MVRTHLAAYLARKVEARHLRHSCRQRRHTTREVQLLGVRASVINASGLLDESRTTTVQFHFRRPRRKLHSKFNALKNSHLHES